MTSSLRAIVAGSGPRTLADPSGFQIGPLLPGDDLKTYDTFDCTLSTETFNSENQNTLLSKAKIMMDSKNTHYWTTTNYEEVPNTPKFGGPFLKSFTSVPLHFFLDILTVSGETQNENRDLESTPAP